MDKFIKALIFIFSLLLTNCVMPSASPGVRSTTVDTPVYHSTENPGSKATVLPTMTQSVVPFSQLPTPIIVYEYVLQPGTPSAMPNFAHPESGCNWMGVGGQIFNAEGKPKMKSLVRLTGTLDGRNINYVALTGGAINLGSGGYEFKLADQPIDTRTVFQITILDDRSEPISQPFSFDTYNACDKNFILINFIQVIRIQNGMKLFLPAVLAEGG